MDYHDETHERLERFSEQFGILLDKEEQRQAEVCNRYRVGAIS